MRYLVLSIIMAVAFLAAAFTHAYAGGKHSGQSDQSVQGNMNSNYDGMIAANPDGNNHVDNLDSGDFRHARWGMSKDKIKAMGRKATYMPLADVAVGSGDDVASGARLGSIAAVDGDEGAEAE